MTFRDRFEDLIQRLGTYQWWELAIELLAIWLVVYVIVKFVQGTRAAGALKGILVLFVVATLTARIVSGDSFARIGFLYDRFLGLVAVALVVIFQPELRRAVIRLGETPFFRQSTTDVAFIVDQVSEACSYLSRARFGALIVIERQVRLEGLVEGGTSLKAELSTSLLQTLFYPGTALHDLAVLVRGRVVMAAGVQLPLAEPEEMPDPSFGSRHRAAVGISKECDALVVVVSEETGQIRLAERGQLSPGFTPNVFRGQLRAKLERLPPPDETGSAEETQAQERAAEGTLSEGERNEPRTAGDEAESADGPDSGSGPGSRSGLETGGSGGRSV